MPYPNEHACRVRQPEDFQAGSFRRKNIAHGIDMILGKLKGQDTMTTQAYRFDKTVFTESEAKEWLKRNEVKCIMFETAKMLVDTFIENLSI